MMISFRFDGDKKSMYYRLDIRFMVQNESPGKWPFTKVKLLSEINLLQ